MEPRGCGQKNFKNLNGELSNRIKEKAIPPTVRETSCAGVPCSGEKYNIHQVQKRKGGKISLPSGPPNPLLSVQTPLGWRRWGALSRGRESQSPFADLLCTSPCSTLSWKLFLLLVSFFDIFPLGSFILGWFKMLKEKQKKKKKPLFACVGWVRLFIWRKTCCPGIWLPMHLLWQSWSLYLWYMYSFPFSEFLECGHPFGEGLE